MSEYTLSPAESELTVRVFKDPSALAARLSHDHVVLASRLSGSFSFDPAAPAVAAVQVTVPVAGLVVDPTELRARVGITSKLSEKDRRDTDRNMRDKGQLWADRFPEISFRSRSCVGTPVGLRVTGDLSVRGRAVARTVDLAVLVEGGRLVATGRFTARATEFGFAPFKALMGALKNQDEMVFEARLVGRS